VKKGPKGNLRGNAQGEVAAQAVVVRDKGARISTTCKQKIHSWGKAVRARSMWLAVKMMSPVVQASFMHVMGTSQPLITWTWLSRCICECRQKQM